MDQAYIDETVESLVEGFHHKYKDTLTTAVRTAAQTDKKYKVEELSNSQLASLCSYVDGNGLHGLRMVVDKCNRRNARNQANRENKKGGAKQRYPIFWTLMKDYYGLIQDVSDDEEELDLIAYLFVRRLDAIVRFMPPSKGLR